VLQHVDLAAWCGWVEAVLGEPANNPEASQRPPPANHVEVSVPAIPGEDVVQVLGVPECENGEVILGVAPAGLGPVDDARHFVAVCEHVLDLEIAVDEDRFPRLKCGLGDVAVASHQLGGQGAAGYQPLALGVESRRQFAEVPARPWRRRRVVQAPYRGTGRGPRRRRRP
jgi:hypothetical protein